ncbi:uncharacterized protein RHO17_003810 [Thomomys bottae]
MKPTVKPSQGDRSAVRNDHPGNDSGTRNDSDTTHVSGSSSIDDPVNATGSSVASETTSSRENTSNSNMDNGGKDISPNTDKSTRAELDACGAETGRKAASTADTRICGEFPSIRDNVRVRDNLDTVRSLSLGTLGSLNTLGGLTSSGSHRQRSTPLALNRILNRSQYISRDQLLEASQPGAGALVGALHGPNSTFLMDDEAELNNGAQIQLRHLILYNDTLIIAKPKSTNSLKLKKQVRLSEVWIASCLDEVTVKEFCADTSFVIGWPTTNNVVTFCSPETKDRWFSALRCHIQEQKQNDFPKNVTLRILLMELDELTSTTLITVTNTETTEKVIGKAVYQLGLSGQASDFLLWVNSSKEALSYPLIGHESLYSIAQTNLRHVTQHAFLKTAEDCPDPTSLSQVPENRQYKFILKHKSKLPSVLERELSEKKSLKKRKSLLYWALQKNPSLVLESSMVQSPEEENDQKLFGLDLSILCRTGHLPRPIMEMLMLLYKEGPTTAGIFRRSANAKACKEIKEKLNSGAPVSMAGESVFVAASVLTEFLRNIPDSVLSSGMHSQWMTAIQGRTSQQKVHSLQRLVAQLPEGNRLLLKYLFGVLGHIVANSEENQMTAFNLALCVAPNLLWLPNPKRPEDESKNMGKVTELVQFLIENTLEIFGEDIPLLLRRAQAESASYAAERPVMRALTGYYEIQLQEDEDQKTQKEAELEAVPTLAEVQAQSSQGKMKKQIQPTATQTGLAYEVNAPRGGVEAQAEPTDAKTMLAQVQAKLAKTKPQPPKAKAKAKAKMALALAEPVEVQAKSLKAKMKLGPSFPQLPDVVGDSSNAKVKMSLSLPEPVKAQTRPFKAKSKKILSLAEPFETQTKPTRLHVEPIKMWPKVLKAQAETRIPELMEQDEEIERQARGQVETQVKPAKKQEEFIGELMKPRHEAAKGKVGTTTEAEEKHIEPAKEQGKVAKKQPRAADEQAKVQDKSSKGQADLTEVWSAPSQAKAEVQARARKGQAKVDPKPARVQDKFMQKHVKAVEDQAKAVEEPVKVGKEQTKPEKQQVQPSKVETKADVGQIEVQVELTEVQTKKLAEPANMQDVSYEVEMDQANLAVEQVEQYTKLQAQASKTSGELIGAQAKPAEEQSKGPHGPDELSKPQYKPSEKQPEPVKKRAKPSNLSLSSSERTVRPKEPSQQALKQKHLKDGSKAPESLIVQEEEVDGTDQEVVRGACSASRAREGTNRCLTAGFSLLCSATRWWPSKRSRSPTDHNDP